MNEYEKKVRILKNATGLDDRELLELLADKYLGDKKKTTDELMGDFLSNQEK